MAAVSQTSCAHSEGYNGSCTACGYEFPPGMKGHFQNVRKTEPIPIPPAKKHALSPLQVSFPAHFVVTHRLPPLQIFTPNVVKKLRRTDKMENIADCKMEEKTPMVHVAPRLHTRHLTICKQKLTPPPSPSIRPLESKLKCALAPLPPKLKPPTMDQELILNKQIILVCDLDLTLLQSVIIPQDEVVPEGLYRLDFGNVVMKVKIRPGATEFLHRAQELGYVLWAYTMGTEPYAKRVVRLLDPKRTLFGDRLIWRTLPTQEALALGKSLKNLPLDNTDLALILDDDISVWQEPYKANVLTALQYDYFNAFSTEAWPENLDKYLDHLVPILQAAHHAFYGINTDVMLKNIPLVLRMISSVTLPRVHIGFFDGTCKDLIEVASALGAECYDDHDHDDKITHVVTSSIRSAIKAKRPGVKVVHRAWLESALAFLHHPLEEPFLFFKDTPPQVMITCTKPPHDVSSILARCDEELDTCGSEFDESSDENEDDDTKSNDDYDEKTPPSLKLPDSTTITTTSVDL